MPDNDFTGNVGDLFGDRFDISDDYQGFFEDYNPEFGRYTKERLGFGLQGLNLQRGLLGSNMALSGQQNRQGLMGARGSYEQNMTSSGMEGIGRMNQGLQRVIGNMRGQFSNTQDRFRTGMSDLNRQEGLLGLESQFDIYQDQESWKRRQWDTLRDLMGLDANILKKTNTNTGGGGSVGDTFINPSSGSGAGAGSQDGTGYTGGLGFTGAGLGANMPEYGTPEFDAWLAGIQG